MSERRLRAKYVVRLAEREGYIIQELQYEYDSPREKRKMENDRANKTRKRRERHPKRTIAECENESYSRKERETSTYDLHDSGVSIIACTKRPQFIENLFRNFERQNYRTKELIIILNKDSMSLEPYLERAKRLHHVRTYRMTEGASLGTCLNFGVSRAKYNLIAKFDDDDYYAPNYLSESIAALRRTGADVVGKRAHYVYLEGIRNLILRFPRAEHQFVRSVAGATLLFRKSVFRRVRFRNRTVGEDVTFCRACVAKGLKIYSSARHNYVAIRRPSAQTHTWKATYQYLLSMASSKNIPCHGNYKEFVSRRHGRHIASTSKKGQPKVQTKRIIPSKTTPRFEPDEGFSYTENIAFDED